MILNHKTQTFMNRREIIEGYTNVTSLTYEMVGKLIEFINVGKRDPVTKEIPIETNWNY